MNDSLFKTIKQQRIDLLKFKKVDLRSFFGKPRKSAAESHSILRTVPVIRNKA